MKRLLYLLLFIIYLPQSYSQNEFYGVSESMMPFKEIWGYKTNSFIFNVKLVNDKCYINTIDGIEAISLIDGSKLWTYNFPSSPTISSVVTFSDKYGAFLTYSYDEEKEQGLSSIYVVDLSNGNEIFVEKSDKVFYKPTIFLDANKLYCIGGEPDDWLPLNEFFEFELDEASIFIFDIQLKKKIGKLNLQDNYSEIVDLKSGHLFIGYDYDYESVQPNNKIICYSLDKLKRKWDYNPSGMLFKTLVSKVIVRENIAYLFPASNQIGIISAVNLSDGEELFDESSVGADNIFFDKNMIYTFSLGEEKYISIHSWYAFDIEKKEKILDKKIYSTTKINILTVISGILGNFLIPIAPYVLLAATPFALSSNTEEVATFIPSKFMFDGLNYLSIYTGKNLVSVHHTEDESILTITKPNEEDDSKLEIKFEPKLSDLKLANFYTPTQVFVTYNGKIASINVEKGEQEWVVEIAKDDISLGLNQYDNSYYLFTTKGIHKLSSK